MSGRRALRLALLATLTAVGAVILLALAGFAAAYLTFRASLPPLDGRIAQAGLSAPVTLERDDLGVVTVTAANRTDLAFGTGFAHGQDRFFEMDLSRRLAAGELSELVGPAALAQDRETRLFRFRALARLALAQASPQQRALLAAYTRGVNAGLASLGSRPWEYWLLRATPRPWQPEDSFLVSYAMWWDLQHGDLRRDMLRRIVDAKLAGPQCGAWKCALEFLYPARTAWDSPSVASEADLRAEDARDAVSSPVPGPQELDVRGAGAETSAGATRSEFDPADIGSNSWAVAGRLTTTGAALVASDMHLGLQVPPTWYHMRLRIEAPGAATGATTGAITGAATGSATGAALDLNGLTLPGAPVLIAGSNGHVAWAFTNSDGDWVDARPVTCFTIDRSTMQTPQGDVALATAIERIHVRGAPDSLLTVMSGSQGILFHVDPVEHLCWFASWLAEAPGATNMNLLALERAESVQQVLALAPQIGIPEQNLIAGDRAGHIGWAIAGRLPFDSREDRTESGSPWRTASDAPSLYDPPIGRLWSANARATSDAAALDAIGGEDAAVGAQYTLGARARQIRDALLGLDKPVAPSDMLRIQLDDRALFLARWRDLILKLLDRTALAGEPGRAEMRRLVASWDARADVDSVGYRLVRVFHDRTAGAVWEMILDSLGVRSQDPPPPQFERPLWTLVTTQPPHLLSAAYPSWRAFLLAQLDGAVSALQASCGALDRCRWGAAHPVRIRHPLSRAAPILSRLIDLPELELPGDHDMPRVQDGAFGASERFAVSPGHEAEGYLHLPGGQSDHPLSPYYRAGFRAWAEGKPLPFLPGPAEHRLVLQPARGAVN